MTLNVANFLRNIQALEYYQDCLFKGISSVEKAKYPNLWMLGKEIYEPAKKRNSEEMPVPPPYAADLESRTELDELALNIKKTLESQKEVKVDIKSNIYPMSEGVQVARIYSLDGKNFKDVCHYDSKSEADDEEFSAAVSNLRALVKPYSVEPSGNAAIIRKAS